MAELKFYQNWNQKLDCDFFTTIRRHTYEKETYYHELQEKEEDIEVTVNGEHHCCARVLGKFA